MKFPTLNVFTIGVACLVLATTSCLAGVLRRHVPGHRSVALHPWGQRGIPGRGRAERGLLPAGGVGTSGRHGPGFEPLPGLVEVLAEEVREHQREGHSQGHSQGHHRHEFDARVPKPRLQPEFLQPEIAMIEQEMMAPEMLEPELITPEVRHQQQRHQGESQEFPGHVGEALEPLEPIEALEDPDQPEPIDMVLPIEHMDPVDVCLFMCNDCYPEEPLLLDCANKVCLNDVLMGNKIDRFWLEDCPGLKRLPGAV